VKKLLAIVFMAGLFALFLYLVAGMPPMGDPQNPTAQNVVPRYIEGSLEETGAENVVTAVVLNYRGYDTLGEVTVIFTAMAGVLAVLGKERKGRIHAYTDNSKVRSSTIVRTFLYFLVPFIILFSVYIILHGLISPGGGFQGGTIIGASMIIFTAIFGLWEASQRIPQKIRVPLETGAVLTFYITGWLGIIGGATFLTYLMPRVPYFTQPAVREWLSVIILICIGIDCAIIFTSILFTMIREEEEVVV
jgi:multicomponent Na+:H+ antiporter subunit B